MTDGFTCHICAALVDPSAAQVALHMRWHDRLEGAITDAAMHHLRGQPDGPLAGLLSDEEEVVDERPIHAAGPEGEVACGMHGPLRAIPVGEFPVENDPEGSYCWICLSKVASARSAPDAPLSLADYATVEEARNAEMVEEFPDAPDPEPPPPPVERHPQIPEETWAELNADQRLDVAERMDRIASRQRTIDEGRNATDTAAATAYLTGAVADLREEYGIELLPAEELEEADLDVVDKPNPPRACEGMRPAQLQERRRFLLAKRGLPGELEEDRQRELALIASLLSKPIVP